MIFYSLLSFACWGIADLFYKIGNTKEKSKYSFLKTGAVVGIVMGIHAIIYMIVNHISIDFMDMLKYLPVSICYILSMVIGYKGLKYIELAISSPVQNTSGVITSILLILFFREEYPLITYLGILLVLIGIIGISIEEYKENRNFDLKIIKKKLTLLAIMLPIAYCIIDGLGTFLDAIYLDKLELISEDSALLSYEFTFLIYAIITIIYLRTKKVTLSFSKDKNKLFAALFETAGQFFYVFAMADDSVVSATIIGS
jgi:drug/metabolite transporter (DMT)-like permease